jgi:hypothetical protein
MPRHPTRPQEEKGTKLLHGALSQRALSQPGRRLTALNRFLEATTRPDYLATSMLRLCSVMHVSDGFPAIKLEVTGIFEHRNWTPGYDLR